MGWWNAEPQAFILGLSRDEITMKQLRFIAQRWDGGYAVEISIIDCHHTATNVTRKLFNMWVYDHGPAANSPSIAHEMAVLGNGEVRGDTAKSLVQKMFRVILDDHEEIRHEFGHYFPRTIEQMEEAMRVWVEHDQKNSGVIVERGAGI